MAPKRRCLSAHLDLGVERRVIVLLVLQPARKRPSFFECCFPYVRPEPVLKNDAFYTNDGAKVAFLYRRISFCVKVGSV
jgi:hypothetical protein